jgi:hypothetical protein
MPQASIFRKKARERNYVERKASPYSIDIDTIIPMEVTRFEAVGETLAVVGRNLLDNQEVRIFRKWSRSPQNTRPNPLIAASQNVQPGGVMLFSGVEKLERSKSQNDYACTSFRTVASNPSQEATIFFGDAVFLDPPTTHRNRLTHQIYNVIQRDQAQLVTDQQSLVNALRQSFERHFEDDSYSEDDSLLIRGFSRSDQIAGAVRVYFNANEDFAQFLYRFRDSEHVIDLVGADENTVKISGNEILTALDPKNTEAGDMTWEVIPVRGVRKPLSARDPARQADLGIAAKAQFDDFVIQKATTILGYHRAVVAVRSQSLESGILFNDIVAMFHDPGAPLPLAVIDTVHTPDLLDVLPNVAPKPIEYGDAGDYEVQDLEALLGSLSDASASPDEGDLDSMNMDILGALNLEETADLPEGEALGEDAPPSVAPAPAETTSDAAAEPTVEEPAAEGGDLLDIDLDFDFEDDDLSPSETEAAQAEDNAEDELNMKLDLSALTPAPPAEAEANGLEDIDLKIDLGALSAPKTDEPAQSAKAEPEELSLEVDLSALAAPSHDKAPVAPVAPAEATRPAPSPMKEPADATEPQVPEEEDEAIDLYTPDFGADEDYDFDDIMKSDEPEDGAVSVASDDQDTPDETAKIEADVPDEDVSAIFSMM